MTDPYLDPVRFPLTTQPGLSREQQRLIDAFNRDSLSEAIEFGNELTDEQQSVLAELDQKSRLWVTLRERPTPT